MTPKFNQVAFEKTQTLAHVYVAVCVGNLLGKIYHLQISRAGNNKCGHTLLTTAHIKAFPFALFDPNLVLVY